MARLFGTSNPNYKTGLSLSKGNSNRLSIYTSWSNMKQRCTNPNHPKYYRYGGRGIKICDEWMTIEGFSEWAFANGWMQGLTIDRIDLDGNYEPSNCRWVTVSSNSRRKSTTKITDEQATEIRSRFSSGETDLKKLAKEYGCCEGNIWWIVKEITHVEDGLCSEKLRLNKKF